MILMVLFVFLLPYLQLGVPVGPYALTLSDAVLICATAYLAFRRLRNKGADWPDPAYRVSWAGLVVLIVALMPGALRNREVGVFIQEMLPYFHALCVIFCFTSLFSPGDRRIEVLVGSYLVSFFVSVIPAALWFTPLFLDPLLRMFGNDAQKYQFLCISPNQYALYALTAVLMLLLSMRNNLFVRLMTIGAAAAVIFMSGSRGGAVLAALLFLYVTADGVVRLVRKQIGLREGICVVVLLALLFGVLFPRVKYRFWNTDRSLSGIAMVIQGQFGDEFRSIQFSQAMREFSHSPLTGIGLGAYRRLASDRYEVHNSFVSFLVENGIIGLGGLIVFLLTLVWSAVCCGSTRARMNVLVALGCVCLYMLAHHVIRERWLWVLFGVIIVSFPAEKKGDKRCVA